MSLMMNLTQTRLNETTGRRQSLDMAEKPDKTSAQNQMSLKLPHSWKTDKQIKIAQTIFPQSSDTCSSTRDSRDSSPDAAISQTSSPMACKSTDSCVSPLQKSIQAATNGLEKSAYFRLFNSKLLLADDDFSPTDKISLDVGNLDEKIEETAQSVHSDSLTIDEQEIQHILGKDLAALILVSKSSDSVSSICQIESDNSASVRQNQICREFTPRVFVPQPQWMPTQNIATIPTVTVQPEPEAEKATTEQSPKKKATIDYRFPDGGWECSKCQNYNFKGRKNCHRCKKSKCSEDNDGKPEHMLVEANQKAAVKAKNRKRRQQKAEAEGKEEKGDWVCQRCFNHNYSFRTSCNRCSMTQEANLQHSEQMNMQASIISSALMMN